MLCAKSGHTRDHWVLSRGRPHLAVGQNRQGRIGKIDHYELRQEKTSHLHDEVHKTARGMQLMLHPPLLQAQTTLVGLEDYEQPLVSPQLMHLRQVPFRTSVNCLQFWQGSPS
jgi:hypothetical protein